MARALDMVNGEPEWWRSPVAAGIERASGLARLERQLAARERHREAAAIRQAREASRSDIALQFTAAAQTHARAAQLHEDAAQLQQLHGEHLIAWGRRGAGIPTVQPAAAGG